MEALRSLRADPATAATRVVVLSTHSSPRSRRTSEFTDLTRRLCCLRRVSTLIGFALAVEIGDWQRFNASSIGAYLGLVPSEHSSGQSRRQVSMAKLRSPLVAN